MWRSKLEQEMNNCISLGLDTRTAMLAVVATYKHVGTRCPANCGLGVEVCLRAGAVWGKLRPLGRRLFASPYIILDIKRQALQAFFLSSQLFQSGCWPTLKRTEYQKCKTMLIRAYRLVTFDGYSERPQYTGNTEWLSDDQVVTIACQFHHAVLLRYLRLMIAITMASRASWNVWCILFAA